LLRGLTERQLGAALLHYLVHLTAYRLRPGVDLSISAALRVELIRVWEFLQAHSYDPEQLLRTNAR
jgi:hypothetical protein